MSGVLTARCDAGPLQRSAADPAASIWVAASAGTGKTSVLTDRVLSLLLYGTPPSRLLCLTFTKAAAAEMANRIAYRLGRWATLPDPALAAELAALTGDTPRGDLLERARRLFAQVVDAPGGLRIETIHAFCQSLLRRFPLEAGVAPHFEVMDERTAAERMEAARDEVLRRARIGVDDALAAALREVTGHVQEGAFGELLGALARQRGRFLRILGQAGGAEAAIAAIYRRLGLDPKDDVAAIRAAACADDALDLAGLRAAAAALARGSDADQARGNAIADWLAAPAARVDGLDDYLRAYLTNDGAVRKTLATKAVRDAAAGIDATLAAEADRLIRLCERLRAATTAAASAALLRLGAAVLDAYDGHKERAALLDYDDLILKTRRLLETRGADWVLYKLDRGLDHILIDEAQDTNPDQWRIVALLAEEFFAGEGARGLPRTVFAVGDVKQSIYSFQGADPDAFETMRAHFAARSRAADGLWRSVALEVSFRSTPAVLQAVDAVFGLPSAADGVVRPGEAIRHHPHRVGQAGLVEIWPPAVQRERSDFAPWTPPIGREAADSPPARLAALIAARIKGWIDSREPLPARGRPVAAGDIMVLVRRRTVLVEELVRALKAAAVPVAGIDRMVLTDQLPVMDLIALARFLLLPEDDLTLATVLKSPLIGIDEEQLFTLAYGRAGSLWQALERRADEDPAFAAAHAYLADLLRRVDFVRPYELFTEVLGARGRPDGASGRKRMLARLGPEAEEPLDEFLALALAYERIHVPSLEGFLHWVESGKAEIKRDPEAGQRDEVRIMTVHGAKGLQAPIVILPDTMQVPTQSPRLLWLDDDGEAATAGFLWPPRRAHEGELAKRLRAAANRKRDQEYRRLLYVAMTRAEDRLYVCGWRGEREPAADCWYNLVRDGLAPIATPFAFDCRGEVADGWAGAALRLATAQEAVPPPPVPSAAPATGEEPLPAWARALPPAEPVPARPLAPSRPAEDEPAVRSPLDGEDGLRFRRGRLVHRLLEALPELAPERREEACRRYLARPAHELAEEERAALAAEVLAVLGAPDFAPLFAPGSRAEVPLTGVIGAHAIAGQVDRLVVSEREVLIVDYKTNRPPPASVVDVAPLYLRQMAAYRALLQKIYPGRPVRCALLWTDGPRLMPLPDTLLDAHAP
ncbi:MAG TPA: double-strand break repair helicase AddA [Alphaproteobacteria bacterium]|nr:double-strand break repair helicase AddA [Alphaproteobacteria bacterium]